MELLKFLGHVKRAKYFSNNFWESLVYEEIPHKGKMVGEMYPSSLSYPYFTLNKRSAVVWSPSCCFPGLHGPVDMLVWVN